MFCLAAAGCSASTSFDLFSKDVARKPGGQWDVKFQAIKSFGNYASKIMLFTELLICHSCSSLSLEKENKLEV